MHFKDLGLMPELERAVADAGYEKPTPIQAATIPVALRGQDVIGCAQTGTGKTAAFCLPALERAFKSSSKEPSLHTLILTPTRELAAQIGDSLATYGKHLDLWHTVIFGGVNDKPQIAELRRGVDILVATPGRLLDLMQRGAVKLDSVQLFVLDEADRMLDMGFIHDVKKVVAKLPKQRQTLFFSATMPAAIQKLASSLVTNPKHVAVDPVSSTVETVAQHVYFTDKDSKRNLLVHLLESEDYQRVVVFTRTKHGSDRVAKHLDRAGKRVAAIHGNKAQNARTRALEGFRSGEIQVLVATDIAARGIDVDDISHVINFELPNVPETYVHRIGRTGRAGKGGTAVSLCDAEERSYLVGIERLTGKRLAVIADHPFTPQARRATPDGEARQDDGRQDARGQNSHAQNRQGQNGRGQNARAQNSRGQNPRGQGSAGRRPAPQREASNGNQGETRRDGQHGAQRSAAAPSRPRPHGNPRSAQPRRSAAGPRQHSLVSES
ncbi:MAG TPA: DEAD/DEAH box helicase [Polyangiaceae bacterium]|nr:DEAD/DEAH box helicase [Polyangiaceae bacterium]